MKISIKDFEEAEKPERELEKPYGQRICDSLRKNQDSAYDLRDIIMAVEPELVINKGIGLSDLDYALIGLTVISIKQALDKLVKDGKVRKATYKGEVYYAIK